PAASQCSPPAGPSPGSIDAYRRRLSATRQHIVATKQRRHRRATGRARQAQPLAVIARGAGLSGIPSIGVTGKPTGPPALPPTPALFGAAGLFAGDEIRIVPLQPGVGRRGFGLAGG